MKFSVKKLVSSHKLLQRVYPVVLLISILCILFFAATNQTNTAIGMGFWFVVLLAGYFARYQSGLHRILSGNTHEVIATILVALLIIFCCTAPMGLLPIWNGEVPEHRNQYEMLTESFLEGKLYIEYGDEEELLTLNNPYDPEEREASGISYHWDHAFYNGRYYMYFGVVPVLLVFLPYRLITGTAFTTFHATQLFTAFIIVGFFCLFRMLARLFFKKMPFGTYLYLSAAFSTVSVWFATAAPSLYCTAITAGICLEIWSIFFFVKAVLDCRDEKTQLRYAFFGALFGALTFGCRPPIGLANIIVLPLLAAFLKQRKLTLKLLGKLCIAALPYLLVAFALMAYNYARFDNVFEFGQSYQLTEADQRELAQGYSRITVLNAFVENFFYYEDMTAKFPHIGHSGLFFNFPIFLYLFAPVIPDVRKKAREHKLSPILVTLGAAIILITAADILGAPFLQERYHMDLYFLAGILCFLMIGLWQESDEALLRRRSSMTMYFCLITVFSVCFHYFYEVSNYDPQFVANLESIICFWRFL